MPTRPSHAVMLTTAALAALAILPGAATAGGGGDDNASDSVITAQTATQASPTSVTLSAQVNDMLGIAGAAVFQVGTKANHYTSTTVSLPILALLGTQTVSTTITGLTTGTTYHYRVVVSVPDVLSLHAKDATFVLAAAPPSVAVPPVASPIPAPTIGAPAPAPTTPTTAPPAPAAPAPVLGQAVVVAKSAGRVTVHAPHAATAVALNAATSIPAGSVIDASRGSVTLSAARDAHGATNSATFWGASFTVTHPKGQPGLTQVAPRGKPQCSRAHTAAAGQGGNVLWGHDHHGRFATRGRNSVATVRGTTWYVRETCAGTVTGVISGSVAVRDLHTGHVRILHAGQHATVR